MSSIAPIESSAATEILTSIARLESELAQVKSVCAAAGLTIPAKSKKSAEKKAKAAAKPEGEKKAPNVWIRFTQQVDGALKAAEISVGAATIAKQFASSLKDIKPYAEWTDADIVAAWSTWEKPEQSKMSSKKSSAASSEAEDGAEPAKKERKPRAKMTDEQKAAAKLKRDAKKADSAATSAAASAAEESSVEEPAAGEPAKKERKPRAKMTEEQKAAAKLKRDAKKAAGVAQPLPASSPSSDGEEAPKPAEKPVAAAKPKPVLKKKAAPASFTLEQLADFDTFTHDGTDYGRNIRGDVSTQDGAYAGHWDGKAIVERAEPADWEAIMRIGQE